MPTAGDTLGLVLPGESAAPSAAPASPSGDSLGLVLPGERGTSAAPAVKAPPAAPAAPQDPFMTDLKSSVSDFKSALATPTQPKGFFQNISDTFNSAVDNVNQMADQWSKATALGKMVSVGETGLQATNVLFSPITAALNSASGIPVVGKIADYTNRIFNAIGAGSGDIGMAAVDKLPISQDSKDTIKPLVRDLSSLAGQMLVGGAFAKGLKVGDTATGGYGKAALDRATKTPVGKAVTATKGVLQKNVIDPKHTQLFASKAKDLAKEISTAVQEHPDVKAAQEARPLPKPVDTSNAFAKSKEVVSPSQIKTMNPTEMPPELRQDIRSSIDTNGAPATHQALQEQFGISPMQADHFVREAPSPQTPEEHQAAVQRVAAKVKAPEKAVTIDRPTVNGQRVTKAANDINENLVKKGFDQLPDEAQSKYTPVQKDEQISKVTDLLNTNLEDAKAMATGDKPIPEGIHPQVLFNAIEKHATEHGDIDLIQKLASSPLGTHLSEAGQTLSAHGFNDNPNSAVARIREVVRARTKAFKGSAKDSVKATASELKSVVRKAAPKKEDWNSFIKSLQC